MNDDSQIVRFSQSDLPRDLRFGVGLRRPHFDGILEHNDGIEFLEIITENFMRFGGRPREVLSATLEQFPVVLHGVSLSIGSIDPLNDDYLAKLKELVQFVKPHWFSDHLSYSSAHGVEYHDLIPLPFTEEVVEHVVARIKTVQDTVGVPFLLENPSYYLEMPGKEMDEAQFITEVVTRADCGLLLDVNNVYVNATNHGYDAREFIRSIPADRVVQYHMAGHDDSGDFLVDTHGTHIVPEVFELFKYTLQHVGDAWTLLEWDNNIPTLETLLKENRLVREAAAQVRKEPS